MYIPVCFGTSSAPGEEEDSSPEHLPEERDIY